MGPSSILPQDETTLVGVLNVTPDSFSDGGRFVGASSEVDVETAVTAALELVRQGAHWIDVGGESTRPGSEPVDESVEIERTRPVIRALAKRTDTPISIDTRKAAVAEAALEAGARVVNDVSGLVHDRDVASVAARHEAWLVIGHLRGEPATMQQGIHFRDVIAEVEDELEIGVGLARTAGLADERILVDPGIGFGKELEHNLTLLANVGQIRRTLGVPVMVGPSRKSFLGKLTGEEAADRDAATHTACAVAVFAGADAVRVHDVAGTRRAVAIARALRAARRSADLPHDLPRDLPRQGTPG
ncbi:MAG: dihydropteroate synthase [Myxococcota bacterium]|nr:dihydropteroate synthase [Myxococcota bacterium]